MSFTTTAAAVCLALAALTPAAWAQTQHEVQMLNRNDTGPMPYAPDFLKIAPGDTVKFRATTSGHNAASIAGMAPEGATPFMGKINEEIEVRFDQPGLYGVRCVPHYAMGMVMLIQVGDEADPAQLHIPPEVPPEARKRFEQIQARLKGG